MPHEPNVFSQGYKRYVTLILLIVYLFNQTDRMIFGFLMEPIKRDLSLSDTQLGFLAGPALALFYATLGMPIARLADRGGRVTIMSIAVAAWSIVVTCSAMVASFGQFALARVGVGVGEAGFSAVAQSLITDYHTKAERTRAITIFMLAIPLGGIVSNLISGWVNQAFGWRAVFLVAGIPGILLAILLKATVREPLRARYESGPGGGHAERFPIAEVFKVLWRNRALRHLAFATALVNTVSNGMLAWIPAFFIRNHGMSTGELGTWLAVMYGVGGTSGIWLGGYLTSRFGAESDCRKVRLIAIATALIVPVVGAALWLEQKELSLLILIPGQALMFFFFGPTFSLVQTLSAPAMRATMASVFILIQVLAGGVIGVQLLGMLSDELTSRLGSSALALQCGMSCVLLLAFWAAVHFWLAGRFLKDDANETRAA